MLVQELQSEIDLLNTSSQPLVVVVATVYKHCLLRTSVYVMCKPWILTIHGLPCANRGSTLCTTQRQAQQAKGEGRNRKEGLRSAAKGSVKDLYLGLGIRHVVFGV